MPKSPYVLEFPRETEPIDMYIQGNWLMWYGDWEVSQSSVCKVESQESWGINPWKSVAWVWRPENQRRYCSKSQFKFKGPKTKSSSFCWQRKMGVPSKEWVYLPLSYCSIWILSDWIMSAYIGKDDFFKAESTDSNANLFQKCLHRNTQKWLMKYVGIPSPVKVTHK
jgi:hypothetical protein